MALKEGGSSAIKMVMLLSPSEGAALASVGCTLSAVGTGAAGSVWEVLEVGSAGCVSAGAGDGIPLHPPTMIPASMTRMEIICQILLIRAVDFIFLLLWISFITNPKDCFVLMLFQQG
jgi:hypothetical protein